MKKIKVSKNYIWFVLIFGLLLIITIYLYYINLEKGSQISTQQPSSNYLSQNTNHVMPTPQPTLLPYPPIPTDKKIVMNGVSMDNFYFKALSIGPIGDTLFVNAKNYKIIYYPIDKAFLISILGSPFESVRADAEKDFVDTLGISKSDACKLSVYITTPQAFNPNQAGNNYTLSFCK